MQNTKHRFKRGSAQSSPGFYLSVLFYVFIVCLIIAAAFAPLSALVLFEKGSTLKLLALLCPVLLFLVALPLRFSFAQALTGRYRQIPFSFSAAFSPSLYGEKVAEGFIYVLHLIKWALPLAASGWVLYYLYNNTEAFTLIKEITEFGAAMTDVWNSVINFFAGIFGGAQTIVSGGIVEGVFMILGIVCVCVLLLVWGIVRNSAYRYIWAEATQLDKNPHYEARRSLRGRRFAQIGVSLINLALLLPVLVVLYILIEPKEAIAQIVTQYADALVEESALPAIAIPYGKLALVFFACYLPFVPIRKLITAYFATARIRRQMLPPETGSGGNPGQPSLLYEDRPSAPAGRRS